MVEPDIVVYKQHDSEHQVVLDHKECDWVFEDCGIEGMGCRKGKAVQMDWEDNGDGSHVQEVFGWQLKEGILIYPGNDPKQMYLNWQMEA